MKTQKFQRTGSFGALCKIKFTKKKKIRWKRARGRHNKIREKKKNKPKKVEAGFRSNRKERGRIEGKIAVRVENLIQAEKIKRGEIVIIGSIGKKKRKEIEEKIKKVGGIVLNSKKT